MPSAVSFKFSTPDIETAGAWDWVGWLGIGGADTGHVRISRTDECINMADGIQNQQDTQRLQLSHT